MGQDIIVDTTMKFIMSDEKNLALALQVEKAMPHVKKKLIQGVKEGVKNRLKQWGKNKNWKVVPDIDENVVFVLQRKDWPEDTGIDLWRQINLPEEIDREQLRVSLPDSIDVSKFKDAFENHIDRPIKKHNSVIYQEIIYWKEENLTKVIMRKDEMVAELTERMKDWTTAVDKALDDLK